MFYTHGELLRRELAELGVGYEPDAGVCNAYHGDWALYRDAAALYWRPHLFGGVPLDTALANMVRALAEARRT